jgi:ribonuclease PH
MSYLQKPIPLSQSIDFRYNSSIIDDSKLLIELGTANCNSGSCVYITNSSRIISIVDGPKMIHINNTDNSQNCYLYCDVQIAQADHDNFVERQRTNNEKRMAVQIREALSSSIRLDLYPKASITIYILIFQSSNSPLSDAINCSSLALLDAGIEVRDIVLSSHCVFSEHNSTVNITLANMSRLNESTLVIVEGGFDESSLQKGVLQCEENCRLLRTRIDEYMIRFFKTHKT